jgi:predicted RNA-binding Zn-ribbon protein involved in translation (DUF1610 family)
MDIETSLILVLFGYLEINSDLRQQDRKGRKLKEKVNVCYLVCPACGDKKPLLACPKCRSLGVLKIRLTDKIIKTIRCPQCGGHGHRIRF